MILKSISNIEVKGNPTKTSVNLSISTLFEKLVGNINTSKVLSSALSEGEREKQFLLKRRGELMESKISLKFMATLSFALFDFF